MVDVNVITDQIKNSHLDKKTETKIRKLLGNSKKITVAQAGILQSIIDDALVSASKIKTVEQAGIFAAINVFNTTGSLEKLVPYQDNIAQMFQFGIRFSSEQPSRTVLALEEAVKQSSMQFITKMGDDLKIKAGEIVADGIANNLSPNDVVAALERNLEVSRARANTIARTEVMRASHAGSYAQAIRDGQNFYIVDSRAEACDLCQDEFVGEVFPIEDSSNMPPLHPNCACIPVFFNTMEEAQGWADGIAAEIQDERKAIEDQGKTINPDGTGSETNKVAPEDRLHN